MYNPHFHSASVPVALKKSLDIRSGLCSLDELNDSWVCLKILAAILHQTLVVQDLVKQDIAIRELLPNDVRSSLCGSILVQMSLNRGQVMVAIPLLMLGKVFFLVLGQESVDKECAPYANLSAIMANSTLQI